MCSWKKSRFVLSSSCKWTVVEQSDNTWIQDRCHLRHPLQQPTLEDDLTPCCHLQKSERNGTQISMVPNLCQIMRYLFELPEFAEFVELIFGWWAGYQTGSLPTGWWIPVCELSEIDPNGRFGLLHCKFHDLWLFDGQCGCIGVMFIYINVYLMSLRNTHWSMLQLSVLCFLVHWGHPSCWFIHRRNGKRQSSLQTKRMSRGKVMVSQMAMMISGLSNKHNMMLTSIWLGPRWREAWRRNDDFFLWISINTPPHGSCIHFTHCMFIPSSLSYLPLF